MLRSKSGGSAERINLDGVDTRSFVSSQLLNANILKHLDRQKPKPETTWREEADGAEEREAARLAEEARRRFVDAKAEQAREEPALLRAARERQRAEACGVQRSDEEHQALIGGDGGFRGR
eukprot:COSAG04_NODE_16802_length_488_cov_1.421594_1_plen_120_part_10